MGSVADADIETGLARRNRQPLIAELSDDVEGLAWLLFECEAQRVRGDLFLDRLADVRSGAKETIGWDQALERLVRTLEVVVRKIVLEPSLRIDEVREDRPSQKLVPQRLPEPFDLAERLRMLRSTTDVLDAVTLEGFLEFRPTAPHGVLPPVVGQHLLRLAVRRDAALERLHHQRRLLVVRDRIADDEAAVVVHEHTQVQPLLTTLQKREDVGLPKLIRRCALEAPWQVLAFRDRRRRGDESFLVQNPPHLVLRHAQRLEARQYVANSPRSPLHILLLERHHAFARKRRRCLLFTRSGPLVL